MLEELANKFPIPLDAPSLFKNELDFDGLKSGESVPEINDCSEIEKKEYKSAWECFKQNAELNDPFTKYWVGYYLYYGYYGEKGQIMARKYFKKATMIIIFSDTQCKYAVSLLGGLCK
ncbi:hypothetical protein F8M41_017868 [Gigaspora margarita]|uniref:Uncharacterized protein n=1 Tax=Gigaspora margarita TaxID=4874 RepID=A0A8H3WRT4_GIGMA|nr:hypothetical protein F8M41_018606 [Gigaspora margarita]KAF0332973.1 hypothetical protein F8M41_017868 [Gigaspora margarita]